MNKALWEVLDGFKIKHDDFSTCEFCEQIEAEMVEKQELTEQDAGRNYNPLAFYAAHTIGTLAPPLFEEWFDFARTFFEDLKEMFLRTWEEEEEKARPLPRKRFQPDVGGKAEEMDME